MTAMYTCCKQNPSHCAAAASSPVLMIRDAWLANGIA